MENPLRNKIALIGYRAVGKTTVSALLGRRYGVKVVDTDAEIVSRAGQEIATIFSERGEQYFRDLEADVMKELLESPDALILSTGRSASSRRDARALEETRSRCVAYRDGRDDCETDARRRGNGVEPSFSYWRTERGRRDRNGFDDAFSNLWSYGDDSRFDGREGRGGNRRRDCRACSDAINEASSFPNFHSPSLSRKEQS